MQKQSGEDENTQEAEVAILPREDWESVNEVLEWLKAFEEELQETSRLSREPHEDAKRDAALKQLQAVIDLAELLYPKNYRDLTGPILETYEALLGIQKGAAPTSLITPKFSGGSPTTSPEGERLQGEAAATMELLMQAGDSPDSAGKKVARRLNAFNLDLSKYIRRSRSGITAKTIKGWRDKFRPPADGSLGAMRF